MTLDYKNTNIFQIYNNYGYTMPYSQVHVLGNTLAIAYYDSIYKRVTVAAYELLNMYYDEQNIKYKTAYKESNKKKRLLQ
jgi:hypothetical protein